MLPVATAFGWFVRGDSIMSSIQAIQKEELSEGTASPGIVRQLAIDHNGHRVLRARVDPGTVSGWHHHGDYTVYGYVVSGTVRLESGPGGKDAVAIGPGGYFTVPPHTVHREVNPSGSEGGEVILFLAGTGPTATNVEGPDPA